MFEMMAVLIIIDHIFNYLSLRIYYMGRILLANAKFYFVLTWD